jgi:hypothetical protein
MRDQGEFTDLVFNHDVGSFNVHRVVVCPQSKVFHKACTGGFEVWPSLKSPFVADIIVRRNLLALFRWDTCPILF